MIMSENFVTVMSVRRPSSMRAACFVRAGNGVGVADGSGCGRDWGRSL